MIALAMTAALIAAQLTTVDPDTGPASPPASRAPAATPAPASPPAATTPETREAPRTRRVCESMRVTGRSIPQRVCRNVPVRTDEEERARRDD